MRIAVVTPQTRHHVLNRVTARLGGITAGLCHGEHEVAIVTTRWWGQRRVANHARWTTHYAGGDRSLSRIAVFRRLRELDPDVVHLVDTRPAIVTAASLLTPFKRVPIVYEGTDFSTPITGDGVFARRARRRLDRVVVPSGVIETDLLESGVSAPIDRVPDPIDFMRIAGTVPDDLGEIVWAAQGAATAEVDLVLLGLAELRDRRWRGVLLGPMEDPAAVRDVVDDLGLSDRVSVIEQVRPRERIAIYRGARVFIQTTPVSPFPTELLLAMAAGCVGVVQYQEYSSAHELVERTRTGELISTPEELADAIQAASNREPRDLDERYRSYDGDAIATQLLDVYRSALTRDA